MEEENKKQEIEEKKEEVAEAKMEAGKIEAEKKEEKTEEKKEKKEKKIKKEEAHIDVRNARISKKQSMAICDYIRGKGIDECVAFLEDVIKQNKALPMKGEIPHRRGDIMAGRFPVNSSKEFIVMLKSLKSNAIQNGLDVDKSKIKVAVPNKGSKVLRSGGREQAKRTHVYIELREHIKGGNKK